MATSIVQKIRMIYWLLLTVFVAPIAYLIAVLPFYPFKLLAPKLYTRTIANWLGGLVNKSFGILAHSSGFELLEYGDRIEHLTKKRCLVLVNHQTHADHFPLLGAFSQKP